MTERRILEAVARADMLLTSAAGGLCAAPAALAVLAALAALAALLAWAARGRRGT